MELVSGTIRNFRSTTGASRVPLSPFTVLLGPIRCADSCACGRLSKFEPCLPDRLLTQYLAELLTELPGGEAR